MSDQHWYLVLGALAAAAAGVPAWARMAPLSYWRVLGFPLKAIRVYLTWAHVAESCGLAGRRRRWRWTLDAVPVAGSLRRASVLLTERHRVRRVEVVHPPGLGLLRPSALGWAVRVRLRDGQVPADYQRAAEQLAHAWRVHAVRVIASAPGRVRLLATRADPLTDVRVTEGSWELLRVRVGMLETGQPWVIDFRVVPHWLNAGATQSGKSNLAHAIIKELAPQPVALAGFDLKGGVEFTLYAPGCPRWPPPAPKAAPCSMTSSGCSPPGCGPAATQAPATSGGSPSGCARCRSWPWSMRSPSCS